MCLTVEDTHTDIDNIYKNQSYELNKLNSVNFSLHVSDNYYQDIYLPTC